MQQYHLHLKGYVGGWDFSSDMISYVLSNHESEEVRVLINSIGGSTFEGMSISALFKKHGNVTAHFIGMSASAATIAAMGASKITMDSDALLLVHKCKTYVEGDYFTAEEIERKISDLSYVKESQDAIDLTVASMYARRCKKSKSELLDLMSKDKWITAEEALDWGFVDEITDFERDKKQDPPVEAISALCLPNPKKESTISKFINWLEKKLSNPQISQYLQMDEFPLISKAAGTDPVPSNSDGTVSLSKEQLDKIESRLALLEESVSQLSKMPAQEPASVITSGAQPEPSLNSYASVIEGASKMLSLIS